MPNHKTVTIYDWPHSQVCMSCQNGEFIQSETFDSSNYCCRIASKNNDGINCIDRIPKEDNDENNTDYPDNDENNKSNMTII